MALGSGVFSAPGAESVVVNGGFENGFEGWTRWGRNAALITLDATKVQTGWNAARIQHGHNALYFSVPMSLGQAYELRFFFRLEGENPAGQVALGFSRSGGALNSAGREVIKLALPVGGESGEWREHKQVFLPPAPAVSCQVSFSAPPAGTVLWLDDVRLRPVARPPGLEALLDPWAGLARRTVAPLFHELLGDQPGGYSMVSWSHDLNAAAPAAATEGAEPGERLLPEAELRPVLAETGAAGLGFLNLPGWLDGRSPLRTAEFLREQHRRYGVRFDVWTEGSPSLAAALKNGAEVLNPEARKLGRRAAVSWVDPKYVDAQEAQLRGLARKLRGEPFVGVYYGKDEPTVHLPQGAPETWGAYGQAMAREVTQEYGAGRLRPPQPGTRAFEEDPQRFLRWLAYNRWANDRFIAARARLHAALHEEHPAARYSPADFWFMSGFVAYDYPRLAACGEVMELDPYASSGERSRGRGVFNHGFGAKFMSDLTGKPVRIVAQAFDYAGYAMTPDDLREWVSQAVRCGASAIDYYTMDRPRTTRPDRWRMMLHLAHTLSRMNRVRLPEDADTAVLYAVYTHMSQGEHTTGDQLYAAHALLGELAGSWHTFISDTQLERGERRLDGYKVVYLPLGRYLTTEATRRIEDYVRAGGVLVCGDAEAFSAGLTGEATAAAQARLLGIRPAGPKTAREVVLKTVVGGLEAGSRLALFDLALWGEVSSGGARSIEVLDPAARVLGVYEDGSPAIMSRPLGRGRVIVLAANPFSPRVTVDDSRWPAFFKGLQRELGCQVERPIWRFLLPSVPVAPASPAAVERSRKS